jgi:hypothetical protein
MPNHQDSTLLEAPRGNVIGTQSLFQTKPRSQFNAQVTTLKVAASSSMIFCSAMLIHSSVQSAGAESSQDCDPVSTVSDSKNRCSTQQPADVSPEPLANQQWSESSRLPKEVETTYSELVNQAQSAASHDQLTTAVDTVAGIPKNSQHYELAQQLEEGWSKEIVRQATTHFQQAEVGTAIALIDKIPESSQWRDRGLEIKQQWQQQAKLLNQAQSAKSAQDWEGAIVAIKAMEGSPLYNSLPVQELLQQAMINRYEPDPALLRLAVEDAPSLSVKTSLEGTQLISN